MLTSGYLIFLAFAVVMTRMKERVAHRLPGNLPVPSCVCASLGTLFPRGCLCARHICMARQHSSRCLPPPLGFLWLGWHSLHPSLSLNASGPDSASSAGTLGRHLSHGIGALSGHRLWQGDDRLKTDFRSKAKAAGSRWGCPLTRDSRKLVNTWACAYPLRGGSFVLRIWSQE